MTDLVNVIRVVALTEAIAITVLLVALLAAAAIRTVRRSQEAPVEAAALAALRAVVLDGAPAESAAVALLRLRAESRIETVAEAGRDLSSVERERLASVAELTGLIVLAERWCRDRGWWRRLRGIRSLAIVGRGEGVVPELLSDQHPLVRAEAAYWVGEVTYVPAIDRLVDVVVHERGLGAFAAQDALIRIGSPAADAIAHRLGRLGIAPPTLLRLAAAIPDPRHLGAALRLAGDLTFEHRPDAIAILAAVGGAEAAVRLEGLLGDADEEVRTAATLGLGQLGLWQLAPRIARLLNDPAWPVRQAAGLSLRRLGAPGELYLRHVAEGEDRYGADMARHVLALPGAGST